jgi:CDK inhibitor PHO81
MDAFQLRPRAVVTKTASSTSLTSKDDTTDSARFSRKFGKHIQKRQLEIPEYAASFVDYKALKKVGSACCSQMPLLTPCSSSRSSAAPQ